ncbi:glycoside hydrolase superfamily [Fimicolochytrium jonesii]|uniref:glycoside hydrolase superfamily n=1 Tax=Fimicolochytrium jonesii TaxID=1396493 RepID=UPI0022FED82C|nr:glycoside hydrolase superfamily [Fimicolochytrium jonesii]KAI8825283.1 glycoside hydrolase superfamily [Fimicolochytrium jonesii]
MAAITIRSMVVNAFLIYQLAVHFASASPLYAAKGGVHRRLFPAIETPSAVILTPIAGSPTLLPIPTQTPTSTPSETTSATPSATPSLAFQNFITRRGNKLYDGDQQFRFVSANTPGLLISEDTPGIRWVVPPPYEQDDLMRSVAGIGGLVARTYTLGVPYHIVGPGVYNETGFVGMDNAIAAAGRNGVRLIVPLINENLSAGEENTFLIGAYRDLAAFRGLEADVFYTNDTLRSDFKDTITYVLNRVNTVTGIRYGDDPTILAWQTGNELGSWEKPPAPADWLLDISTHIKSLSQSLVMDGTIGGSWRWQGIDVPTIDIYDSHLYGTNDTKSLREDAAFASLHGKVHVIGEYGLTDPVVYDTYMDENINNPNITGSLIWSLRGHANGGGLNVHSEGKNGTSNEYEIVSYHVPGLPPNIPDKIGPEETTVIADLRRHALAIQNLPSTTPYPAPIAPVLLTVTNGQLTWRGSAWAASYTVFRGNSTSFNGTETPLAMGVLDNVSIGDVVTRGYLWADASFVAGMEVHYAVQAVGVGGDLSPLSNVI